MISQRMMVGGGLKPETWAFSVNTEATAAGEKKTAIPFNLVGRDGGFLDVDWGDGTLSRLTSDNYTLSDSMASVHEYASVGEYQVLISSTKWSELGLLIMYPNGTASNIATPNTLNEPLYWFRRTIISVDSKIPNMYGTLQIPADNRTSLNTAFMQHNKFPRVFLFCGKLLSVPDDVFMSLPNSTDFYGMFQGSGITSISRSLLQYNTNLTILRYFLYNCTNLGDFSLDITSRDVSNAGNFVSKVTTASRTVYVPSDSTTETTFNGVASTLGLTVIGE